MIKMLALSKVCSEIVDCPHESPEWLSEGVPVIRNFNLVNGMFDFTEAYYVDESTYQKRIKRAKPSEGDIIFSREAPIGNCAMVPREFKCCLGQRLVLLRVDRSICSPEYLLTVLRSTFVKKQIQQIAKSGSIVSNFGIGDLKKLVIPVISEYDKAASFSQLLNSKMTNNIKLADTFETMTSEIFLYWFRQFEFPNDEGKPYRSSGGEMVMNEELGYKIPLGWKVKKVGDLVVKNTEPYIGSEVIPTLDLSVMPSNRISQFTLNTSDNFETNLFKMKKGDLLFGSIRPYLKKAGFAPCDGAVAGTVYSLRCRRKEDETFMLHTLCSDLMFKYAVKNSKGTKMPVIGLDELLDFKFAYSEEVATEFDRYNYLDIVSNLIMQNNKIDDFANVLLPLLMNEQVKIV